MSNNNNKKTKTNKKQNKTNPKGGEEERRYRRLEKRKTNKQHGMYATNRENLITTVCHSFSTADCFLETEEDLNPSVHPRYPAVDGV